MVTARTERATGILIPAILRDMAIVGQGIVEDQVVAERIMCRQVRSSSLRVGRRRGKGVDRAGCVSGSRGRCIRLLYGLLVIIVKYYPQHASHNDHQRNHRDENHPATVSRRLLRRWWQRRNSWRWRI